MFTEALGEPGMLNMLRCFFKEGRHNLLFTQKFGSRCDLNAICVAKNTPDSPTDPDHELVSLNL